MARWAHYHERHISAFDDNNIRHGGKWQASIWLFITSYFSSSEIVIKMPAPASYSALADNGGYIVSRWSQKCAAIRMISNTAFIEARISRISLTAHYASHEKYSRYRRNESNKMRFWRAASSYRPASRRHLLLAWHEKRVYQTWWLPTLEALIYIAPHNEEARNKCEARDQFRYIYEHNASEEISIARKCYR